MTEEIKNIADTIETNIVSIVEAVKDNKVKSIETIPLFKREIFQNADNVQNYSSTQQHVSFKRSLDFVPMFSLLGQNMSNRGAQYLRKNTYYDEFELTRNLYKRNPLYEESLVLAKNLIEICPTIVAFSDISYYLNDMSYKSFKKKVLSDLKTFQSHNEASIIPHRIRGYNSNGHGITNTIKASMETLAPQEKPIYKKGLGTQQYEVNYFYCAHQNQKVIGYYSYKEPKPLYCLMVKKEYIKYVKTCIFMNIKINPQVFEFWIDESLDNPKSEERIRLQFNKILRKHIELEGIKIVVHPNLQKSIVNLPVGQKFKSIIEEKNYIKEVCDKVIKDERRSYGIINKAEELDKMIESIIDTPASNIMDNIPF